MQKRTTSLLLSFWVALFVFITSAANAMPNIVPKSTSISPLNGTTAITSSNTIDYDNKSLLPPTNSPFLCPNGEHETEELKARKNDLVLGTKKVLFIRAESADIPYTGNPPDITQTFEKANAYFRRNSYGKADVAPFTITPIYEIDLNQPYYIRGDVLFERASRDYNMEDYDIYVFCDSGDLAGAGGLGVNYGAKGRLWLRSNLLWFHQGNIHEMIHAFGPGHAEGIEGGDISWPGQATGGNDPYYFMGSEGSAGLDADIPAYMKYWIGWLDSNNIIGQATAPSCASVHRIYKHADRPTLENNKKVSIQLGKEFWISYEPDSYNNRIVKKGVLIHNTPTQSPAVTRLIDTSPNSITELPDGLGSNWRSVIDFWDAAMTVGENFELEDTRIEVLREGGSGIDKWVDIRISNTEAAPSISCNDGNSTTVSCDGNTTITYGNGNITMSGQNGNDYFFQVLDAGWNEVYNCGWQCGTIKSVDNLTTGDYRVRIKDSNYEVICEKVITLSASGGNTGGGDPDNDNDGVPASQDCNDNDANLTRVGDACNDGNNNTTNDVVLGNCTCAGIPNNGGGNTGNETTESCEGNTTITYGNGNITMSGQNGNDYFFQVFDAGWNEVYNCGWQCGTTKSVANLAAGDYRVHIKNSNYEVICERVITLSAGGGNMGGGDPDNDNDGVLASQDCNDNDANLTTVGAACNDGNPNTRNDVVQGNCTCAGTSNNGGGNTGNGASVNCGDLTITYGQGTIDMTGATNQSYFFKINDLDNGWAQVFGCSWNCGNRQTATELANGSYLVSIYNDDWTPHCDVRIEMTNSSYTSNAGSRNAAQLNFEAYPAQRKVQLQWLTNSGYKVAHFEVEHSEDGQSFTQMEKTINKEWTEQLAYHQATDLVPSKGANYYRVKEVYLDGSFAYTDVQKVNFTIDLAEFFIFPNPAKDELFLNLTTYQRGKGKVSLMNSLGKVVYEQQSETLASDLIRIDVSTFSNGLYYLKLELDQHKTITKKVIVQRLY